MGRRRGRLYDREGALPPRLRREQPAPPRQPTEYLTDAFTREAISFIERRKKEPFFLLVASSAVHTPLQVANRDVARFAHIEDVESRVLAAMLSNLDDGIGAIVDKLHATGFEEDTMVIFLSDNGAPTSTVSVRMAHQINRGHLVACRVCDGAERPAN